MAWRRRSLSYPHEEKHYYILKATFIPFFVYNVRNDSAFRLQCKGPTAKFWLSFAWLWISVSEMSVSTLHFSLGKGRLISNVISCLHGLGGFLMGRESLLRAQIDPSGPLIYSLLQFSERVERKGGTFKFWIFPIKSKIFFVLKIKISLRTRIIPHLKMVILWNSLQLWFLCYHSDF